MGRTPSISIIIPAKNEADGLRSFLARLRELSATALEMTRRALDLGNGRTIDAALKQVEDIYLLELMKTSDAGEGISAFMEKRKPVWRNR